MATKTKTPVKKTAESTPKPVKEVPANKVKPASANILGVLHLSGKRETVDSIAKALDTPPANVKKALKPLVDELFVEELLPAKEGGETYYRFVGQRVSRLSDILEALRTAGKPLYPAEAGMLIWADPKKPQANDATRFMAPAGAALKNAFELGAIGRITTEGGPTAYYAL